MQFAEETEPEAGSYLPEEQGSQLVAPSPLRKLPAPHGVHRGAAIAENMPGWHDWHAADVRAPVPG